MPWTAGTPRRALERAGAELLRDATRSNELIGEAAGCGHSTVSAARRRLEAARLIEAVPVSARARRPYPMQLSPTFVAIELGARTAAEVAAAAGCSPQAAWKALKHRRRWPDDTAAARDRLDVRRSIACEQCGTAFVPVARKGGRGHRFCSPRCAADSWNARKRIGPRAEPLPNPGRPPGGLAERIPAAVLSAGLCTTGGLPSYWTSNDQRERELAKDWCRACPVRIMCAEWSVQFLPRWDTAVYAAMDARERRQARKTAA